MAFKPGVSRAKEAGRKKGTPNKKTQALQDKAAELGVDPFEILLLFAAGRWEKLGYDRRQKIVAYSALGEPIFDDVIPPDLRQKSAADACQYIYPKRKAIDILIDPNDVGTFKVTLDLGDEHGDSVQPAPSNPPAEKAAPKSK